MKIDTLITKYTNKVESLKKQVKEAEDKLSLLRELQIESVLDSLSSLSLATNSLQTLTTSSLANFNNTLFPPSHDWDYLSSQFTNTPLAPDAIKPLNINDIQIKPLNLDSLRKF